MEFDCLRPGHAVTHAKRPVSGNHQSVGKRAVNALDLLEHLKHFVLQASFSHSLFSLPKCFLCNTHTLMNRSTHQCVSISYSLPSLYILACS